MLRVCGGGVFPRVEHTNSLSDTKWSAWKHIYKLSYTNQAGCTYAFSLYVYMCVYVCIYVYTYIYACDNNF